MLAISATASIPEDPSSSPTAECGVDSLFLLREELDRCIGTTVGSIGVVGVTCDISSKCLLRLCSSRFSFLVNPLPELRLQFGKGQNSGFFID